MVKKIALLTLFLFIVRPAAAEETYPWPAGQPQKVADWLSYGTVGLNVAADTLHSWRAEDRREALTCQAIRVGILLGSAEVLKRVVHRVRPNSVDAKSFPSMHTGLAEVTAGWRIAFGVPVAIGTGYLRHAANWHYLSDVAAGGLLGEASRRLGNAVCT